MCSNGKNTEKPTYSVVNTAIQERSYIENKLSKHFSQDKVHRLMHHPELTKSKGKFLIVPKSHLGNHKNLQSMAKTFGSSAKGKLQDSIEKFKYDCDICGDTFPSSDILDFHQETHFQPVNLSCDNCPEKFSSEDQLENHVITQHKQYPCLICKTKYVDLTSFNHHKQSSSHILQKFLQMPPKPKLSSSSESESDSNGPPVEEQPVKVPKPIVRRIYRCEVCNKKCRNPTQFVRHVSTHSNKEVTCLECGLAFKNRRKLRIHRVTMHGYKPKIPPKRKILGTRICQYCGEKFEEHSTYKNHLSRKHREHMKDQKCKICGEFYKHGQNHIHMKTHEFPCHLCGKMIHDGNVEHHMGVWHTENKDKPFVCNQCGKGFIFKFKYDAHVFLHTGIKPHVCDHCGTAFAQVGNLQAHIRSLHFGIKRKPRPNNSNVASM